VIILSSHNDDASVENATNSGAAGFLLKQTSALDVCRAIREVYQGKTIFSPSIAKRFSRLHPQLSNRAGTVKPSIDQLTSRQMEVLQLIAEGKANKEMAAELGIDIKTVEKHRQNVMQKLDIHDTAGLTRYAISAGIIESRRHLTLK
jgi:DNA-binding NarL/FixJ family response regulator